MRVLAVLAVLGCRTSSSAGEFEDDAGLDEAAPPDLLKSECDPRMIESCPSGQKCSYVVDAELGPTNRCVDLLGDKLEGDSCTQIGDSDDCAAQRICWATEADGSAGVCVAFCDHHLQCESEDDVCTVANAGLLSLCLPRCDPLAQDCAEGWGCYPDPNQRWACDRDHSGDEGIHGDPCECINCCDPGFACMSGAIIDVEGCGGEDGAAGCCAEICELDEGQPVEGLCPSELERCEPFYDPNAMMQGFEQVGICRL